MSNFEDVSNTIALDAPIERRNLSLIYCNKGQELIQSCPFVFFGDIEGRFVLSLAFALHQNLIVLTLKMVIAVRIRAHFVLGIMLAKLSATA